MRWLIGHLLVIAGVFSAGAMIGMLLASGCPPCDCAPCEPACTESSPGFVVCDSDADLDRYFEHRNKHNLSDRLWERTAKDCGAALSAMRASLDACQKHPPRTRSARQVEKLEVRKTKPCPKCPEAPSPWPSGACFFCVCPDGTSGLQCGDDPCDCNKLEFDGEFKFDPSGWEINVTPTGSAPDSGGGE